MKGIRSMRKGMKCSAETKAKISAAQKGKTSPMKGKTHSNEAKAKMSAAHKGKTGYWKGKTGYWKGKTGPMKGKKLSDETKEKLVINSIISGRKAKPVLCITTGEKFSSQKEAARCLFDNTMNSLNISKCCKGKASHFKGYQFKYI